MPLRVHSSFQPPAPLRRGLAALALVTAGLLAWTNSFSGPFVFDDRPAILANPTLDHFTTALSPPVDGGTVAGRPFVNLSFWLNRALGGTDVRGYHAFNLAVHLCAALVLFGLFRRTFALRASTNEHADGMAFSAALLWTVHPLQTAAVTYTVQRAETLAALCILLTLYALVRAISDEADGGASLRLAVASREISAGRRLSPPLWLGLSALACLAGMGCKETAAVTPLLVFLFLWANVGSRSAIAGSLPAAGNGERVGFSVLKMWAGCPHPASASRDSEMRGEGTPPTSDSPPLTSALPVPRWYFLALAATWIPLAWLVFANGFRSGTAGPESGITPLTYALTQSAAIVHYLKLAVWPSGLVFDYGTATVAGVGSVLPQVLLIAFLLVGAVVLLRHAPRLGFLATAFFLLLAPSSSVVPIATQTVAEHRMYLPLAALTLGAALLLQLALRRHTWIAAIALAVPMAVGVHLRNRDYASGVALWSDTVAKRPDNPRAHAQLGNALTLAGRPAEALPHYEAAVRLAPENAANQANLATALVAADHTAEAIEHYEAALKRDPKLPGAELNLAQALSRAGRSVDALSHYAAAETRGMIDAGAHYNYGVALARAQRFPEAAAQFNETLKQDPTHIAALVNLGNTLLLSRRIPEAITAYESALRLRPDDPQILRNLIQARALSQ